MTRWMLLIAQFGLTAFLLASLRLLDLMFPEVHEARPLLWPMVGAALVSSLVALGFFFMDRLAALRERRLKALREKRAECEAQGR